MVADQIQIARQTAIPSAQQPIDAPVLERTEDPASQRWNRKQVKGESIVDGSMRILRMSHGRDARATFSEVAIQSKSIARILIRGIVELGERSVRSAQIIGVAGVGFKLNLSGGVCRQHFVKSKVQFFIAEFSDYRRQVNGATVANA